MSRRGLVLEGYQAPSGSKEVDPMAGQRLVAEERMHDKTLAAQKEKKPLGDTNKAFEYIDKNYNPNTDKENSNVIQQKADEEMASIKKEAFDYLKQNPNASQFEIAQLFGERASKVNQLYTKGRSFQENANKAALEIAKIDPGINPAQLSIEAQKQAFLDPQTGKVRDDISFVDPNDYGKYMDEAIKNSTMKVLSDEGLKKYVYDKDAIKTDTLDVTHQDSKKGLVREKVTVKIPQAYELEKNEKGFNVLDKEGRYSVVPKSETLPDGSKILDEGVFNSLPRSAKEMAWGEARIGIKAYNMANGTDINMDSIEADKIARKFAYVDMARLWNNGGVERVHKDVAQPAPRITINNGGTGVNSKAEYNDTWGRIVDKYKKEYELRYNNATPEEKIRMEKAGMALSMNKLDTDAINLIVSQVNANRTEDTKIKSPNELYVRYTDKEGIRIYKAEIKNAETPEQKEEAIFDGKHLIATLPPSSNLKTPQANSKAKVSAQSDAKEREKDIENKPKNEEIPTYSRSELKAAKWTDDQINKAIKAGKIKVN